MNVDKKLAALACIGVLVLGGCSMNNDVDSKTNQTKNDAPQDNLTRGVENGVKQGEETMDNMISYFKEKGVQLDQMKTLDQMDFAAHEGRSFSYQGNTGYFYRLKSDDENMKALLESAQKNGTVKVNIDGKEQDYKASVNGDYLFVYGPDADMNDVVTAFGNYTPNMSTLPYGSDMNGNVPSDNEQNNPTTKDETNQNNNELLD